MAFLQSNDNSAVTGIQITHYLYSTVLLLWRCSMEHDASNIPIAYKPMLAKIRIRRWYLWGVILIYMPVSVTTLQLTQSYKATGILLLIWFILLCTVVTLSATAKCPRCGNNFHMRDSTLSYFRNCRHCGLHMCEDKYTT